MYRLGHFYEVPNLCKWAMKELLIWMSHSPRDLVVAKGNPTNFCEALELAHTTIPESEKQLYDVLEQHVVDNIAELLSIKSFCDVLQNEAPSLAVRVLLVLNRTRNNWLTCTPCKSMHQCFLVRGPCQAPATFGRGSKFPTSNAPVAFGSGSKFPTGNAPPFSSGGSGTG